MQNGSEPEPDERDFTATAELLRAHPPVHARTRQRRLRPGSALDLRYPMSDDHPLTGRRVPDVDLKSGDGPRRVHELLRTACPVLLDLRGDTALAATAESWADRVDLVEARSTAGHWPVWPVDETPAPAALLIRPDGHAAWTAHAGTTPDPAALRTALTTWFGPATAD